MPSRIKLDDTRPKSQSEALVKERVHRPRHCSGRDVQGVVIGCLLGNEI